MSYRIESADKREMVLVPTPRTRLAGAGFLILGLLIIAFPSIARALPDLREFVFPLAEADFMIYVGFGSLAASLALPARLRRRMFPRRLRLRNDAASVRVESRARAFEIAYGRLRGTQVRRKSQGRFITHLLLKDGSYLDLRSDSKRASGALQRRVGAWIEARTREIKYTSEVPDTIRTDAEGRLIWKDDLSPRVLASLMLVTFALVFACFAYFEFARLSGVTAIVVYGSLALVVSGLGFAIFRAARVRQYVQVDEGALRYGKLSAAGEARERGSIPRDSIHALQLNLDLDQGVPRIFALDKARADEIQKLRAGEGGGRLRGPARLRRLTRGASTLSLVGLDFVDALHLRARLAHDLGLDS